MQLFFGKAALNLRRLQETLLRPAGDRWCPSSNTASTHRRGDPNQAWYLESPLSAVRTINSRRGDGRHYKFNARRAPT